VKDALSSLGRCTAVIGAQWGDEGKGKLIDILAERFDVIARACGGANAGHTIVVKGKRHVFRLLPSGSLHEGKPVILGGGMVIHLPTLLEEIQLLEDAGIEIRSRIKLASNAHIVFEFHKAIDGAMEEARAKALGKGIGTTKRGIGPAYADKMLRRGLRVDALTKDIAAVKAWLTYRTNDVGVEIDVKTELAAFAKAQEALRKNVIADLPAFMADLLDRKKTILVEGAQATLLDIDHGTYPYVTSSQTTVAGALQGLGLPPKALTSCVGVAKAYCTRVGEGDFPTEVEGATGDRLRERGGEYGSVTKRPRRCGWLHLPDLAHAARINGFDCWNITKLDVLDQEAEIPVGVGVNADGSALYETFKGWKTSTLGVTAFEKLPKEAQKLLNFIEKETGIPVRFVGTGQGREEMVLR
jgi:adenylosuccinate synthase